MNPLKPFILLFLSLFNNKKAQVTGQVGAIITLTVGLGVAILVLIFVSTLGGQTFQLQEPMLDQIGNNVVTGDTLTRGLYENNRTPLAHGFVQNGTITAYNVTSTFVYGLGNFTIEVTSGLVRLADGFSAVELPSLNGSTDTAFNYTWGAVEIKNKVKDAVVASFTGLETTADYMPIIVLALVIFMVLTIVLTMGLLNRAMGGKGGSL